MKKQDRVFPPYYFFSKDYLPGFLRTNRKIALFLDYDGTLVPIQKDPKQCFISDEMKNQLRILARAKFCHVIIISGRSLPDIKKRVGIKEIYYSGNHGLDISCPNIRFTHPKAVIAKPVINYTKRKLKKKIADIDGAWLEDKGFALSLHYRSVRTEDIPRLKEVFYNVAGEFLKKKLLVVIKGKKVLDLVPEVSWNKGKAVIWILQKLRNKCLPIYIGDDQTDETAFKLLRNKGITIRVGKSIKTLAKFYVKSYIEVSWLLYQLRDLIERE